jgi:phenylacetate-coenzyme A ligase PaaK-like adenylate-forming protein
MTTRLTGWERFAAAVRGEVQRQSPEHIARLSWNAERVEAAQRAGLAGLLAHAVEHSPFHRERLAGIDVARIDPRDLSPLPVMTKHDMMSAFDDVLTDRSLSLELVEEALAAAGEVPAALDGQYVAMASGGSSGQRGVFVFDRAALVGFTLSLSRNLRARLEAFGGPPPGGLPIGLVAAAAPVHATGLVVPFSDADDAPFRFHPAPATLPLAEIVERLNATRPAALFGYPSMLHRLAGERREGRLDITPIAVTSTSETLLPEVRETIAEAFGVPVGNTFGSTEGLVGVSEPGEEPLTFNSDLCIVELVNEDDQPVPPGTPSAKVLVTNLYNRAQPLIRYELTDSFVRQPDAAEHGHLRACVEGRMEDPLRYDDVDVHPHAVRSALVATPAVLDYQVRQTPRGIEVDVVTGGVLDLAELQTRLTTALATAGLRDPEVDVRVVDDLDRNAATGKLRRFVPLPAPTAVR